MKTGKIVIINWKKLQEEIKKHWLKIPEIAKFSEVSRQTIYNMIKNNVWVDYNLKSIIKTLNKPITFSGFKHKRLKKIDYKDFIWIN